jgi:hypothetical protein
MMYATEMATGGILTKFRKIGDLINLILFFQNKENRLIKEKGTLGFR